MFLIRKDKSDKQQQQQQQLQEQQPEGVESKSGVTVQLSQLPMEN